MVESGPQRDYSLALHAFTASGVLVGMAALVAVLDGSARAAIAWLLVAQLIDGIDGPLARRLLPDDDEPVYDGYVLDLVIDFVTCVLVPAAFLWQFDMIPHDRYGMLVIAALLMTSSLWFSRTDQISDDGWFRGFPSAWNMVVPTLWIMGGNTITNVAVIVVLSVLTLSRVEFAHPVRTSQWRRTHLVAMLAWIVAVVIALVMDEDVAFPVQLALMVGPVVILSLVMFRALGHASDDRLIER